MNRSVLWIANPHAGAGRGRPTVERLAEALVAPGRSHAFAFPETSEAFARACESAVSANVEALLIAGGDGTVFHSLPALRGRAIKVGYLPLGTANDCASELGMSLDASVLDQLLAGDAVDEIDLIEVNGRPFATVGGIGVGAHLLRRYNELRNRSRFMRWLGRVFKDQIYSLLSAWTILTTRSYLHRVRIEGGEAYSARELTTGCVFVCNQAVLGKRLRPAPNARNNDGRFDVLILTDASRRSLLRALVWLRAGRLPPDAVSFQTDRLTITDLDGRPIAAFADGEHVVDQPKLSFVIDPRALHVFRRGNA